MVNEVEDTIFDKILRKEIPADVIYEDEDVFVFKDINPVAPTHVLVIPKWKVTGLNDLTLRSAQDVGAFFQAVARVAIKIGLSESGYRIVINSGRDGQQTVEYLHAHILGGRQMSWPPG